MTAESTTPRTPGQPAATATATTTDPAPPPRPASAPPMPAMPSLPPPPPVYRRRYHVARPAGVLPAAAVAGIVGATVIPLDRPGIGWLLAGGVVAGALGVVDHRARRSADSGTSTPGPAQPDTLTSAGTTPSIGDPAEGSPSTVVPTPTVGCAETEVAAAHKASTTYSDATPAHAPVSSGAPVPADEDTSIAAPAPSDPVTALDKTTPQAAPAGSASATEILESEPTDSAGAPQSAPTPDSPTVVTREPSRSAPTSRSAAEATESDSSADAHRESAPAVAAAPTTSAPSSVENTPPATEVPSTSTRTAPPTAVTPPPPTGATETAGVDPVPAATVGPATGESSSRVPTPPDASTSPTAEAVAARHRLWWTAAALALLGVGTFRAAGWLFVLCVLAACVAGSLGVLGRRSNRGIVHDMVAVPLASFGAVPWAFSGVRGARPTELSSVRRYGASVAVTAALLVVFVPLLGGADATFAELLSGLVPSIDAATAWQWILLFAVIGMGALGGLYLLAGPLAAADAQPRPARLWTRSEWVLPVGALTVLFGVFLGAQFVALFGGDDYVQRTAGLTYAEYARSGFWQLSVVSILTLAVILAVLHWASQETAADRRWLRVLLGAVSVLALVIVGSALARMWTYQQAYGFTVLRLLVEVCELWVGLVYVLVLVAIARLRWSWVPRAAVGTALATLLALAVLDPERFVAERNIARWEHGKRLDTEYLSTLSPDILPALDGLPAGLRADIEDPIRADLDDDHWWSWNLSRGSAR
ncbi:DUF4153 domain-containing protein [Nocardia canadensis]|uniref:DUF4153 domain-containing protein n=1 Tax=Nocardia canadensis TaxID=3065238 RepID=UPI0029307AEB|nr:DUF4153 domain-containing protein [Nocardia canadensis]